MQLSEVLATSKQQETTNTHSHQWMDENGWIIRTAYLQNKNGDIYEATLNIADGRDRKILYEVNKVHQVDKTKIPGEHTATGERQHFRYQKTGAGGTQTEDGKTGAPQTFTAGVDGKNAADADSSKNSISKTGETVKKKFSMSSPAERTKDFVALHNTAKNVTGTYAMAGYATDSAGREFAAIITVEQKTGRIAAVEAYDMLHAVSGRQKKGSQADTKSQSIRSIKATKISISDLLQVVNSTHQSILPEDVLQKFSEQRNPQGDYTGKVKFSSSADQTPAEQRKQNDKTALDYFGRTYKWSETGYVLLNGARLDFSGRHEGGPGGYRTVDHRDIIDALGEGYGGGDYSGGMVRFMQEGNIRISTESGGINLAVMPTKAQRKTVGL